MAMPRGTARPFRLRVCAGGLVLGFAILTASQAGAKAASPAGGAPASGKPAAEESLSERRAVRGVPVDDAGASESAELREIRRFEELAFPRPGAARASGDGAPPPSTLPGSWGGSGDVPPELRSLYAEHPEVAQPPDSEWLRRLKLPDLPVRWDPQVLRYLDYFKNDPKGHAVMANWLRRAGRYHELCDKVLARQGLPRDLFYVAMVESGFDTGARSRVGAGGIWQFMPGAARAYGLEVSYWTDARRDPERAMDAAARYLKDLYVRFGSWYLVFAAYNAGYGAVLRSITNYNTNDYWELVRHESGLPWESSLYVPKILAAAVVGNNLAAFGFPDLAPDAPFAYEEVEVPAGTTLATVARAAKAKPEVVEALNPHLVRGRTPPDRGLGRVRVPPGTAALCAASFEKSRTAADKLDTVVLRFGETLDEVARTRGVAVRELRRINGVKDSAELRAGMPILVPKRGASAKDSASASAKDSVSASAKDSASASAKDSVSASAKDGASASAKDGASTLARDDASTLARDDASASARDDASASAKDGAKDPRKVGAGGETDDMIIVAVPERAFGYEGRERVFYRTRDGDELDEIADAFGVRNEDLVDWNNLDPGAKLHPKMVLQIFVRKDFDPAGVILLDASKVRVVTLGSEEFLELETARRGKKRLTYTAKAGDTLAKLGRRYGLTPGDLARINRFSYNTELHEGDRVVVYSPTGEAPREVSMGMTPSKKRPERGAPPAAIAKPEGLAKHKPAVPERVVASGHSASGAGAKKKPVLAAKAGEKGGDKTGDKAGGGKKK